MSGKPGRSGGKRPGAGAPVRTIKLAVGDCLSLAWQAWTIKEVHPDNYGAALLKYWEDGYRLKVLSTIGIISTSTPVEK